MQPGRGNQIPLRAASYSHHPEHQVMRRITTQNWDKCDGYIFAMIAGVAKTLNIFLNEWKQSAMVTVLWYMITSWIYKFLRNRKQGKKKSNKTFLEYRLLKWQFLIRYLNEERQMKKLQLLLSNLKKWKQEIMAMETFPDLIAEDRTFNALDWIWQVWWRFTDLIA